MATILSEKSKKTPFICGLKYSNSTDQLPVTPGLFNVTKLAEEQGHDVYASLSAIDFTQKSNRGRGGNNFKQQLRFQFPNGDVQMHKRINEILSARYMQISLTDGSSFVIGRNDFEQNTAPTITVTNNTRTTQVNFLVESIFPVGISQAITSDVIFNAELLPQLFPIM